MTIYLPIAEMSVNIFVILALGGVTGLLSGMFGIGGGFLMTPLLIFIGVPPTVAVASTGNQIVASSVSSFMVHWQRRNVDFKMGLLLLAGGLAGSTVGILIFSVLKSLGQIDLVISLSYVSLLTIIGSFMSIESINSILKAKRKKILLEQTPVTKIDTKSIHKQKTIDKKQNWIKRLPLQYYFARSDLTMSIIIPPILGFLVGTLVSIMGIGGGFFMIPAMIYILKMPTQVVVGTSLFQVIFVTSNVTILHAINTQTVDIVLAFLLLFGSVISAQIGARLAQYLPTEYLRILLSAIVIAVAARLAYDLISVPSDLFSITLESIS